MLNENGRNFSLEDVHVEGTERIVDAVAKYDVDRYIHVSSYNANPESTSEFYATKVLCDMNSGSRRASWLTMSLGPW